jgi:hypothetical protein
MRSLFAFLLGIGATLGFAYVHDNISAPGERPYVNWDVVGESTQAGFDYVRGQWDRLTNRS